MLRTRPQVASHLGLDRTAHPSHWFGLNLSTVPDHNFKLGVTSLAPCQVMCDERTDEHRRLRTKVLTMWRCYRRVNITSLMWLDFYEGDMTLVDQHSFYPTVNSRCVGNI